MKLRFNMALLTLATMLFAVIFSPVAALAQGGGGSGGGGSGGGGSGGGGSSEIKNNACGGGELSFEQTAANCSATATAEGELDSVIANIINVITIIVGIIAVIMIIYGGFKYVTAGGDTGNITTARNAIIYAIVGLVIVALAQVIVRFVVGKL